MAGFEIFMEQQENIDTNLSLPLFKEIAINFEDGEPIIKNNEVVTLEGIEALKVWIWKILKTERKKYEVYSENYGTDLIENIGQIYDEKIRRAIIQNEIITTLMINPYITSVNNFNVELDDTKQHPIFYFNVDTIYGEITGEEVNLLGN